MRQTQEPDVLCPLCGRVKTDSEKCRDHPAPKAKKALVKLHSE